MEIQPIEPPDVRRFARPDERDGTRVRQPRSGRSGTGRNSDEAQELVLLDSDSKKPSPTRRRARKSEKLSSDDVTLCLWILFGLAATLRGEHWRKSQEELEALGGPLAEWIASLPANKSKAISKWMFPISIILASSHILAGPIKAELELARIKKLGIEPDVKPLNETQNGFQGIGQPEPNLGIISPNQGGSDTIEFAQFVGRPELVNDGSPDTARQNI